MLMMMKPLSVMYCNMPLLCFLLIGIIMQSLSVVKSFSVVPSSGSPPGVSAVDDAMMRARMEETVRTYFQGVHEKDAAKIRSCFGTSATIDDICGLSAGGNNNKRTVPADQLVNRCMDFVTAHPNVQITFLYGPECGRSSHWVVAHWYETGTWSGDSCGIPAPNPPIEIVVQGQTRFLVDPTTFQIIEFVVSRTFTEWEQQLLQLQQWQQQIDDKT